MTTRRARAIGPDKYVVEFIFNHAVYSWVWEIRVLDKRQLSWTSWMKLPEAFSLWTTLMSRGYQLHCPRLYVGSEREGENLERMSDKW